MKRLLSLLLALAMLLGLTGLRRQLDLCCLRRR